MEQSKGSLVVSVSEVRELLGGISRNTVYSLLRQGQIPSVRCGRRILIPRQRLMRWLGIAPEPEQPTNGTTEPDSASGQD